MIPPIVILILGLGLIVLACALPVSYLAASLLTAVAGGVLVGASVVVLVEEVSR